MILDKNADFRDISKCCYFGVKDLAASPRIFDRMFFVSLRYTWYSISRELMVIELIRKELYNSLYS